MSIIELKNQLDAQFSAIVPPYTGTDVRQRLAEAVHAGVAHPVSLAVTHGAMAAITSPGGTPRGFTPIDAYDGSGNPLGIASCLVNRTGGGSGPIVGVTVKFAPPLGRIVVQRTTNYPAAYAATSAFPFSSILSQLGSGFSWNIANPTRVVCNVAGRVRIATDLLLWTAAAGGYRESYWVRNVGFPYVAYVNSSGGGYASGNGVGEIDVSAGQYLEQKVYQNQTAGTALDIIASSSNPVQGIVEYVAPLDNTTGTVRGIVWDG